MRTLCSILLIVASTGLFAQDTLIRKDLKEAEVVTDRNPAAMSGTKALYIDSLIIKAYQQSSLAELLAQQSGVFIKSYGLGMLASSSFRGSGAAHTMVLWNGFNLQSPTSGQLDLSLIPVAFLDEVAIQYGGSGARYGSGAMGGAIVLSNRQEFQKGLSLKAGAALGSFGYNSQQLSLVSSGKRYIFSIKSFAESARNNFPYTNLAKEAHPKELLSNNRVEEHGLLQENYFKLSTKESLNLRVWYQYALRQIPPTMQELSNKASQKDRSLRLSSEWKHTEATTNYTARASYINETLHFLNPTYNFDSESKAQSYIAEAEAKKYFNSNNVLNLGINNTCSIASLKEYSTNPTRNCFAVFGSYRWTPFNEKLRIQASVRQEWLFSKALPTVPALGIELSITPAIALKTALSKIYRLPTFNDLYWAAGGNPDLLPENGWSRELGAKGQIKKGTATLSAEFTWFNRNIENWILWQPSVYGYWTPNNVLKVNSSGTELNLKSEFQAGPVTFRISALGNYVLSVNRQAKSANDESLNKQLIYVPVYTAQANLGILYKRFFINYTFNYTGYRYTSADNFEYLKPYRLGNIQASYTFFLHKYECSANLQGMNLWSEVYQSVAQRPMPLRHFRAGFTLKFNSTNTHK